MALHQSAAPSLARPASGTLAGWAAGFDRVHVDLGAGDGKYALHLARHHPGTAVIGLDGCLDHLRGAERRRPGNLRFVALDALDWPAGLIPEADTVTVNFPYGSLLRGLAEGDPGLFDRIDALLARGGRLEARVNASAFSATGLDPACGPEAIVATLRLLPGARLALRPMPQAELRSFPSSWAKRIGYGKPTAAWLIAAAR